MDTLADLQEQRTFECRLTPDRALETLDEAEEFLRDRLLLTRTPDSSLPSLFGACHEEPYKPGAGGFAEWPATKWSWSFEIVGRAGVVAPKIHRGKTLYLSLEGAALADAVCRAEIERMEREDEGWARLLRHLGDAGPALVEDLKLELGLSPSEFKELRAPLERCGAIVGRQLTVEGDWVTELARWDQVVPQSDEGGLEELVVAAVRSAVVVPERAPARWFSWRWRFEADLVERLVADEKLYRPEPGWLAAR